jgi:hypothetical protein
MIVMMMRRARFELGYHQATSPPFESLILLQTSTPIVSKKIVYYNLTICRLSAPRKYQQPSESCFCRLGCLSLNNEPQISMLVPYLDRCQYQLPLILILSLAFLHMLQISLDNFSMRFYQRSFKLWPYSH